MTSPHPAQQAKPYLSICAIYRDEAPYLREWVEFHRHVGVEKFFLYNNNSADAHRDALGPYLEEGCVVLRDWPLFPGQVQAYTDCLERHRHDSRWIIFIDLDEFLFSPTGRSVPEVLVDYEAWPGVVVNRAVFGTSGHREKPPGLVIENYVRRTDDPRRNGHFKSIVDPTRVGRCGGAHHFDYPDGFAVNENYERVKWSPTKSVSFARLRLNHYVTKSESEARAKIARPRADTGEMRLGAQERFAKWLRVLDEVTDKTITAHVPAVRAALAQREVVSFETR